MGLQAAEMSLKARVVVEPKPVAVYEVCDLFVLNDFFFSLKEPIFEEKKALPREIDPRDKAGSFWILQVVGLQDKRLDVKPSFRIEVEPVLALPTFK